MIVCLCHDLSDAAIRAELASGARTAEDVARATGAGTDCGCCRETVEALVRNAAPCAFPPCPGCPKATGAWRAAAPPDANAPGGGCTRSTPPPTTDGTRSPERA